MRLYQMADAVRYEMMNTDELRETFLLEGLFQPGEIEFAYVDLDRTVIGSAVPVSEELQLETEPELRAEYFLERRELGVFNVGGPGTVVVDGKSFDLEKLDCLYVGRGSRDVVFSSKDGKNPANFYLLSYPAHAEYPTAMVKFKDLKGLELGSLETCNKRTIYKAIYKDGIKSCQLVMGFTLLAVGSNWNTMPAPHPYAPQRGLLLLRCRSRPPRPAPHGTTRRNQPPGHRRQRSSSLSRLVHSRRRRHQELRLLLGHGRRKPGLRRHGPRHNRRPPIETSTFWGR